MQDYLDVCINTGSTVCKLIGLSEHYNHALHAQDSENIVH